MDSHLYVFRPLLLTCLLLQRWKVGKQNGEHSNFNEKFVEGATERNWTYALCSHNNKNSLSLNGWRVKNSKTIWHLQATTLRLDAKYPKAFKVYLKTHEIKGDWGTWNLRRTYVVLTVRSTEPVDQILEPMKFGLSVADSFSGKRICKLLFQSKGAGLHLSAEFLLCADLIDLKTKLHG